MAAPAAARASACRDWPACRTAGVRTPGALTAKAAARVEARGVAQLLVELLLPLTERPGQHDAEIGVEVAGAAVRLGQPLAAEPQLLAARRARRDFQRDAAFERRDFDLRPQCSLPRRDRHFQMQVVAGQPEQGMRSEEHTSELQSLTNL